MVALLAGVLPVFVAAYGCPAGNKNDGVVGDPCPHIVETQFHASDVDQNCIYQHWDACPSGSQFPLRTFQVDASAGEGVPNEMAIEYGDYLLLPSTSLVNPPQGSQDGDLDVSVTEGAGGAWTAKVSIVDGEFREIHGGGPWSFTLSCGPITPADQRCCKDTPPLFVTLNSFPTPQ